MLHRRVAALLVVLAITIATSSSMSAPAAAVTYGAAVPAPSRTVPWVVSLFHSANADATDPRFICTASALSSREVLTAAHCLQLSGFYFVSVGGDRLTEGRLVAAEAIVNHRGYSDRSNMNDVATLRTLHPLRLNAYARAGSPALARQVNGSRPPMLTLYGWGQTQTGRITKRLSSARLDPQSAAARTTYGRLFRPELMLAAGRYDKAHNTYRGACYGDSGGPLVVTVNDIPYVVGVTSFGTPGCRTNTPTIFTSVGAYRGWLSTTRRSLAREAVDNNRALPESLKDPSIAGAVALGATLTCHVGRWTANTASTAPTWHYEDGDLIGKGRSYVVTAADAGHSLHCEVEAASDAGSVTRASALVIAPATPAVPAPPATSA